ncbi:MAG TPA: MFS transporter [Thermoplasmata archaeon]|nr:MFS transporter [Thermoplasmata archaeon]
MTEDSPLPGASAPGGAGAGPTTPHPDVKRGTLFGVLIGLMLGILMGALDNTIVVTALPGIVTDLGNRSGLAFVVTAYLVAQTVAMPIFGKLSDHFGRRLFFLLGLVLFIVGSMLSGISQNFDELLAFRALQGMGSGAFFPVANSIIGVLYPPQQRARLSGVFSSVFGVAIILGPLLGSFIVDTIGWRWIFYVNLPIGIVSFLAVITTLGPLRSQHRMGAFDWQGAALLAGWVAPLVFVLNQITNGWSWTAPSTLAFLLASVAVFAGFLTWESRASEPLVPLRFFRSRVVAASNVVSFLRGVVMLGGITFVTIIVTLGLQGNTDTVRNVLYGFLGPMIIGSLIGGTILPRVGYRPLVIVGLALMALGSFLLISVSPSSTAASWTTATVHLAGLTLGLPVLSGIVLLLIPAGLGIGVTFAPVILAVQYGVPPRDIGAGSSIVQFMGNLGGSIGLSLLGSYQAFRFTQLSPAGPNPCTTPPSAACAAANYPYFLSLSHAFFTSFQDVFLITTIAAAAAFVVGLFITGRLPGSAPATESARAAETPEPAPMGPG